MSKEVVTKLKDAANEIYERINELSQPTLNLPVRSLSNVTYNAKDGYFELAEKVKKRTLTANTIKTFAQTLRVMGAAKEVVETDDIMTKRELYYVSKNWGDAKFNEQPESDTVMEDLEAMMGFNREQLGFIAEDLNGSVAGKLTIIETDPETGDKIRHDCTKFVTGAYSIPSDVEELKFESDAKFILAIEVAGMFQRLVKHKYWKDANCILASMGGVPSRAFRRFVRRVSDDLDIPVYVFTDGDPYGYLNIYRTLTVGSGNAAHINKYFCVPNARFIGITPDDIVKYDLPSHPLKDVDIKRIKDGLKNDPFVHHHKSWQKALNQLLKMKVRAEQQALAKHGLNFVISNYLPEKLADEKSWLA